MLLCVGDLCTIFFILLACDRFFITSFLPCFAMFSCNLLPIFSRCQHRISTQGKPFLDRGRESRLVIDNVTYDYQGEYECRATNFINGQERTATSDPIALQVVGAPQVLRTSSTASGHSVSVRKGDPATLSLIVCADPRPRHVSWEWGSLRLEAGSGIGKYFRSHFLITIWA